MLSILRYLVFIVNGILFILNLLGNSRMAALRTLPLHRGISFKFLLLVCEYSMSDDSSHLLSVLSAACVTNRLGL